MDNGILKQLISDIKPIDVRAELFKKGNFDFIVKKDDNGEIKEHKKQREALEILTSNKYSEFLYGGGAGSAKTWTGCAWLLFMGINYPETRYFVARNELKALEESVLVTFHKVCREYGYTDYKYNAVKHYITLGNGSVINFVEIKKQPSDPLYETLGSTEYTAGWIEEVGEIDETGAQVLSKRAGRHMNDRYGINKIIFYTCNPKKNWAKREFYDKWKKGELESFKCYLPALVLDNPFIEKSYAKDLESYKNTNKVLYERLYKGNWDYEDNPYQLTEDEMIDAMFSNNHVNKDAFGNPIAVKKYITADVARFGSDKARIGYWEGWDLKEVISLDISKTTDVELAIRTLRFKHKIARTRAIGDADGVGCVSENTEVLTDNGWIFAKDLKKHHKLISKSINGFIEHKNPTEIVHLENEKFIETEEGYVFTETHAHFYRTRKEHDFKVKYWDDISEYKAFYNDTRVSIKEEIDNDIIVFPKTKGFNNILEINKEVFFYFLGWISSDGSIDGWNNKHVIRISQSKNSPNIIKIENMLDSMNVNWIRKEQQSRLYQYEFQHKGLFNWIKKECYFGKPNFETKKVPEIVKHGTKKNILKYIEGYLDGDGYFHKGAMQFVGTNKKLLDGIQEVLFYCGIRTKFHVKHKKGSLGKIDERVFERKRDSYLLSEITREKLVKTGIKKTYNEKAINIFLGNESKAYLVRMANDIFWTHNGGVIDGAGIKGFNNNARPIRTGKNMPNYKNLQVQCLYHLADKINHGEINISADLTSKEREEIKEEMGQIQSKGEHDPERKLDCKSKADIKDAIGRSPDFRDMMLMRSYFDLKKSTADLQTKWK